MSLWRPIAAADPFGIERSMRQMQQIMSSMFSDMYGDHQSRTSSNGGLLSSGATFTPCLDVEECDAKVNIKADLPGMSKDNINLQVRDGTLWLSGQTVQDNERNGTYYLRERWQGSFRRAIPLPPTVDTDAIQAKFDEGVLSIELPKKQSDDNSNKVISIQ